MLNLTRGDMKENGPDAIRVALSRRWVKALSICFVTGSAVLVALLITFGTPASAKQMRSRPLTIDDRVNYERALQSVYLKHRISPKGTAPRSLEEMVPPASSRARVYDTLQRSNALD